MTAVSDEDRQRARDALPWVIRLQGTTYPIVREAYLEGLFEDNAFPSDITKADLGDLNVLIKKLEEIAS